MALTATGTMIQEMGAAIMASPTNPHLARDCCSGRGARAYGGNGWNGHCEPCYKNVRVENYY